MILPSRRSVFLMAGGLPPLLAMLPLYPSLWNWAILWAIVIAGLLLLDFLLMPTPGSLDVAVEVPPILFIGESDPLTLSVQGRSFRRRQDVEVAASFSDHLAPQPRALVHVGPEVIRYEVPLSPLRRGPARIEAVHLRWLGPLRLMARQHDHVVGIDVPVVPNTRAVSRAAPRLSMDDLLIGLKQERRKGEGSEFEALKEFDVGMDRRRIDWKRSAKHGKLLVKEFDAERNHQIIFGFDCGQLMGEPLSVNHPDPGISRLDLAINSALMLAHVCLRAGDRIGLFAFDAQVRHMLEPMGGSRAFPAFAQQAGRMQQSAYESNYTLALTALGGRLQRRSLIIIFSEFVDTTTSELMINHLARLGKRHLLLFVTFTDSGLEAVRTAAPETRAALASAVVAQDVQRERRIVLERLRRSGLMVIETTAETLTAQLIERYADIRARELI